MISLLACFHLLFCYYWTIDCCQVSVGIKLWLCIFMRTQSSFMSWTQRYILIISGTCTRIKNLEMGVLLHSCTMQSDCKTYINLTNTGTTLPVTSEIIVKLQPRMPLHWAHPGTNLHFTSHPKRPNKVQNDSNYQISTNASNTSIIRARYWLLSTIIE